MSSHGLADPEVSTENRAVVAAQRRVDQIWDQADTMANLPDPEDDRLSAAEAHELARSFDIVLARARGRHAAPISWLPAPAALIASALAQVENQATEDGDWARIRRSREAFVDLQAFLPDDEASAAESFVSSSSHDRSDDKPGQDALERVTWAQAIAISLLRDDEKVVGSYNALNQIDIVIGEAQASLEVVDRHKESQAVGFAAFVILPISIVVGAAVGSFLWGLTLSSVASAAILAALSFLAAPWYGWLAGGLSSRLDRRAMRSDHMRVVVIGRSAATVVSFILYFVLPVVFGIGVARICTTLGLP